MKKSIHVAAGVIIRNSRAGLIEILLAKRPMTAHKGGLWEFPGGKVERGETAEEALKRELGEELAIDAQVSSALLQIPYDYPEKSVLLDVWLVSVFAGEPMGNEGQEVRWVSLAELDSFDFPEANAPIVDFLQRYSF